MNFYLPTRVVTGKGAVAANAALFSDYGKKCVIVTGRSSARLCGALDDVTTALERQGIEYEIYDKIKQNPEIASCIEGGALAKTSGADFIVGIGGGSPLDAAKAIAVFAANDIDEDGMYAAKWACAPLPVIAVGTTAGTGSEVTQVAVITDSCGKKRSFRHDKSFPVLAFGDVRYTAHMPESVMRSTAIDALAHCVESYFCKGSTELSQAAAIKGTKDLVTAFKKMLKGDALDDAMLESVYKASLYGGYAISVTGTAFPHALGYFLSEDHGVAHGTACGLYLPEFLKYNHEHARELSDRLYAAVDADCGELCDMIERLLPTTDITVSDSEKDALMPRWAGHKCLAKMHGNASAELLDSIVRKLF